MISKKLHSFNYKYNKGSGPLSLSKLKGKIKTGNCRLAVQDYFYIVHNLYLKPEEILLPAAFRKVGRFVKITDLKPGDLIYAERLRNKEGKTIYKAKDTYNNENE